MPVCGAMQLIKKKGKEMQVLISQSYKHVITFQKSLNCKYWSLIVEICSPRIAWEYNRFSLLLAAKGSRSENYQDQEIKQAVKNLFQK